MNVYFWAAVATIVASLISLIDWLEKCRKHHVRRHGKRNGRRRQQLRLPTNRAARNHLTQRGPCCSESSIARTSVIEDRQGALTETLSSSKVSVSAHEVMQRTRRARSTVILRIHQIINDGVLEPIEPKGSTKQRHRLTGK